jgi:predicted ATPase/transcriptional regulator with XRE-family HTH domain/Tfp pilus assembly protein PilF
MREDATFGAWLRQRRKALDLTQDGLAERVSCSVEMIRKLEAGTARPSHHLAEVLVARLETSPADHPALVQWARGGAPPAAGPAVALAAVAPVARWPTNLPAPLTDFIGRERERAAVTTFLRRAPVRLVTLTGPGGIGKTRLGLEVASALRDTFADGVWLVELAALTDPDLVAGTIAATLPVPESGGRPVLERLHEYLRERHLLLVLDNCEQVLAAAGLVEDLLKSAPRLKVLATSRAPLRVYGEREFLVPPLTLPDRRPLPSFDQLPTYEAVRLFVERTQAVQPAFVLNAATAPAVVEICWRLDGLPLAIELAAARGRLFPPAALLARLDGALNVLTGGVRTAPVRQQTLRAAIDWSYQLLTPPDQRLFRRMAVFQGGCTLEALDAVGNYDAGFGGAVPAGVESLVEQSLVQPREGRSEEPRFGMLETIHAYAREKLAESGEGPALQREHARYFMQWAEAAEIGLTGAQQAEWFARVEDAHDNIRAALRWAREQSARAQPEAGEIGMRIAGALWRFWYIRGYHSEGRTQLAAALAGGPGRAEMRTIRAKVLNGAGNMAWQQGDYAAARTLHEESLAIRREVGDPRSIAASLANLGNVAHVLGDYAAARTLHEESLAIRRKWGDQKGISSLLGNLGNVAAAQGDYAAAGALYEESLAIGRALGETWAIAGVLGNLGYAAHRQGDVGRARQLYAESLRISRAVGARQEMAIALAGLGAVAGAARQPVKGARLLGAVETLLAALGLALTPEDRAAYEQGVAAARAQLDNAAFAQAWAEGGALGLDQAIEYALQEMGDDGNR